MGRRFFVLFVLGWGITTLSATAFGDQIIGRANQTCCTDPSEGGETLYCHSSGPDLRKASDEDAEARCQTPARRTSDYQTRYKITFSCTFYTVWATYQCE